MTVKSDEIDIFIRTCGERTFQDSLACVKSQYSGEVIVVENVKPVNASFNYCINQARAKYFAIIDADVLISENSLRRLLEVLKSSDDKTAIATPLLYDDFYKTELYAGFKVYNRLLVKDLTYRNILDDDRSFNDECRRLGQQVLHLKEVLGRHGTSETDYSVFKRDFIRSLKYRIREIDNSKEHGLHKQAIRLMELYSFERDSRYLFGALGSVLGLLKDDLELPAFDKLAFESEFATINELINA